MVLSTLAIALAMACAAHGQGQPQSVGLVLSGGGAKGIAHIGVIRALEENDIPIDYITGTSMGSIVGGLYAAGYTPDEMMTLILSEDFAFWSTGRIDPGKVYYFSRPSNLPVFHSFDIATDDSVARANAVPASVINPLPMNFAFMDLFAAYTAQCGGDFNRLMVPYRCVASDVAAGHKVVHGSGSLGDAIRTSMSFPIIFQPIKMPGGKNLLYDGGIFDNFPVDVMTVDFAPDIMIGVDVAASDNGPQTSIMDQIENLVMRRQSYDMPPERGIKLRVNLDEFSLLDFQAAREIERIGHDHAMAMMDSIKSRVTSRITPVARNTMRGVFKSRTPAVVFDSISVHGASADQRQYLEYLFEPAHTDTFGLAHARESFYRAISNGRLKDLFPQAVYRPDSDRFTLDLKAAVKSPLNLGVGGYITSATNSYIFLNAAYRTFAFAAVNTSVNAWIGQSYMAGMVDAQLSLRTAIPSALALTAVASRERYFETDHLFYETKTPTFILNHEYFGRLDLKWAAGARGAMSLGVGVGRLVDSFIRTNSSVTYDIGRDHNYYTLGQIRLQYSGNTLDNYTFPTRGSSYDFIAQGLMGRFYFRSMDHLVPDEHSRPKWLQLESRTRNYWSLSNHFSLGMESDVVLSTRKLNGNYNSSLVAAPAYNPTPASYNSFNIGFRANSFAGLGVVPVYKFNQGLSARLTANCFMPLRRIIELPGYRAGHGKWFSDPQFFGEFDVSYALPFATISGYVNYATSRPTPWAVGVNFGIFILAPRFMR